jgi:hypothetical protein
LGLLKSAFDTLKVLCVSQYCCHPGSIAEGLYFLLMVVAGGFPESMNHFNRLINLQKLEAEDKPPPALLQFCQKASGTRRRHFKRIFSRRL